MARQARTGWLVAGLASRGRRLLSAAVAIVIGVAFLALSLATITTAQRGMEDAVGAGLRDAALVVSGPDGLQVDSAAYDEIAALPEVADARGEAAVSLETTDREWVYGSTLPTAGVTLLQGEMPDAEGEVLANPDLAAGLDVGEELTLLRPTETGDPGEPATVTVSGVADFGSMSALAYGRGFAAEGATLRAIDPALSYGAVLLDLADGADEAQARAAVTAVWADAVVQTGPEAAAERVAAFTGGTDVLAAILLGFGAVALATAAIVIANTFTITLAQRTGELALLRAVGATVAQVRRQVLLEAAALGLVASAVGVGLGLLGSWGLLQVAGRFDLGLPLTSGVAVTPVVVLVPLAVGLVVTVLASLWPAVRATRVSPLAALRPAGGPTERRRVGGVRVGIAVLLVAAGTALMLYAASSRDILSGVAGGLVSFVGVLVAAVVVVPAAVRALGVGARLVGAPGRLAVDNAVRNPGRAASTSAALLVGVTLITMTSIGAASAERTALGEIDSAYAVDFMVGSGGQYVEPATDEGATGEGATDEGATDDPAVGSVVPVPLPAGTEARVAAAEGVQSARAVDTAYLTLDESLMEALALGLDPARDGDVVRSGGLADLEPGTVGMGNSMLAMNGLEPGDVLPVHGPGGSADLRVVELAVGYNVAVTEQDLARLGGGSVEPGAVLVRLADGADVARAMTAVQEVADTEGLSLTGAAMERALITQVLDVLVLVTTGLLGVAVVIAVVGIANTLSLSVVERHREHALLRGLGLTRGQMRGMLLTEGVLLALVSAGLGLLLGVGYAVLGIQTVLPEDTPVQLAVPWGTVGLIAGVALLAGALASVLPARTAARVSPAEGLAAA